MEPELFGLATAQIGAILLNSSHGTPRNKQKSSNRFQQPDVLVLVGERSPIIRLWICSCFAAFHGMLYTLGLISFVGRVSLE